MARLTVAAALAATAIVAFYGPADFSPCETSITDWDDESQVWNCQLDGLATLNTSLTSAQDTEATYLNSLIALGVDGFRWDSAKEMNPQNIAPGERDAGALVGGDCLAAY